MEQEPKIETPQQMPNPISNEEEARRNKKLEVLVGKTISKAYVDMFGIGRIEFKDGSIPFIFDSKDAGTMKDVLQDVISESEK